MKLALGQTTEVVARTATEEIVALVEVEVADSEEADREDIKLPLPHFLLNKRSITTGSYNTSELLSIFAGRSFLANALLSGFQTKNKTTL